LPKKHGDVSSLLAQTCTHNWGMVIHSPLRVGVVCASQAGFLIAASFLRLILVLEDPDTHGSRIVRLYDCFLSTITAACTMQAAC
jgi:hypothetical protein